MNLESSTGAIWESEFLERLALCFGSHKASPLSASLHAFAPEDAREREVHVSAQNTIECVVTQWRDGKRTMYFSMLTDIHGETSRRFRMGFDERGETMPSCYPALPSDLRTHWRRAAWLCGLYVDASGHEQAEWTNWAHDELETFGDVLALNIKDGGK